MKRVTTTLCIAAVMAWSMALGAQSTQSGQMDQTQQPRGGTQTTTPQTRGDTQTTPQRDTSTVSFIGCVASSSPDAFVLSVSELPGTSATTGTGADVSGQARVGDTQVGISGQAQVNRPGQATGTTGTNVMVGSRVQLIGSARSNIGSHVGHKVEITGTLVPQGTAQGRTTGQPAAETWLNVSNVRMISAMCDATSAPQTQPRNQGSGSTTEPGSTPGAAGTSGTTPAEPAPATGGEPTTPSQSEPQPDQQQREP